MLMEAALSLDIDAKTQLECVAIFKSVVRKDTPIRSMLKEREKNIEDPVKKEKKSGRYDPFLGCTTIIIVVVGIIWIFSKIAFACNPSTHLSNLEFLQDSAQQEMPGKPGDTLFMPDLPDIPAPEMNAN
jgi:hypothetical protein